MNFIVSFWLAFSQPLFPEFKVRGFWAQNLYLYKISNFWSQLAPIARCTITI